MKTYFLQDGDLAGFVSNLMSKCPVIAPVAKRTRFVFQDLESVDELRLDYDTTILPPKKVFFPPQQDLVKFDGDSFKECIDPKDKILFGVHAHDIKGIDMTDALFAADNSDENYLAQRRQTTIVGSSVQNHYKHAFFGSVCPELEPAGHDMFLTKVDGGYVADVLTEKGEALISSGNFADASEAHSADAAAVNQAAKDNCPEKLNNSSADIKEKVRDAFSSDIWEESSKGCFSCGSCNLVCPTCYCFDVQDEWGLGAADGKRFRKWDGCLTCEFSEVSVQGGKENFREKAERYRHRFMRKTAYLNDKIGGPACVGCGRCSGACTADIANPVTVINKIMEG